MLKASTQGIKFFYLLIDTLLMSSVFAGVYLLKFKLFPTPNFKEYLLIFLFWGILIILFLKNKNLYTTDRSLTFIQEFFLVFNAILYPSVIIVLIIFLLKFKFFSRFIFGMDFILLVFLLWGWRSTKRAILRTMISKGYNNFNVLIVGAGKVGKTLYETVGRYPYLGLRVVGFIDDFKKSVSVNLPILGNTTDIEKVCKRYFIDEVFITIPSERQVVSDIMKKVKKMHIGLRIVPENFEQPTTLVKIGNIGFIPILTYKERAHHRGEVMLKSLFDLIVSFLMIVFLSPLFFIISVLIKLDSRGSIFYKQKRIGKRGRVFYLYKFRSMVKGADNMKSLLISNNEVRGGVIFKLKNDPRVTRVGKLLRKYSLDEMPQLYNVLFGDMSLVGPRPFPVEESNNIAYNHLPRYNIRPGITGLAQIKGRSDLSFYRWMKWDLWYVNNWSFGLDLWILWKTIPVVLKGKGAY